MNELLVWHDFHEGPVCESLTQSPGSLDASTSMLFLHASIDLLGNRKNLQWQGKA
jgi:hypothetical protein